MAGKQEVRMQKWHVNMVTMTEQNISSMATATSATLKLNHQGHQQNLHPRREARTQICTEYSESNANDPSAGSPTETLLRLLLPLSDKVH